MGGHLEVVKFLIDFDEIYNEPGRAVKTWCETSEQYYEGIDIRTSNSIYGFRMACVNGHIEILKLFLKKEVKRKRFMMWLDIVCLEGTIKILKLLFEYCTFTSEELNETFSR